MLYCKNFCLQSFEKVHVISLLRICMHIYINTFIYTCIYHMPTSPSLSLFLKRQMLITISMMHFYAYATFLSTIEPCISHHSYTNSTLFPVLLFIPLEKSTLLLLSELIVQNFNQRAIFDLKAPTQTLQNTHLGWYFKSFMEVSGFPLSLRTLCSRISL